MAHQMDATKMNCATGKDAIQFMDVSMFMIFDLKKKKPNYKS